MRKVWKLEDLDCANCAAKLERAIREIEGVVFASVSFMTQKLTLETEGALRRRKFPLRRAKSKYMSFPPTKS